MEAGKTTQQEATILVTSHPLQAWVPGGQDCSDIVRLVKNGNSNILKKM